MLIGHLIMTKARKVLLERNVNKQERGKKGMGEAGGEREVKNALIQVIIGMSELSG